MVRGVRDAPDPKKRPAAPSPPPPAEPIRAVIVHQPQAVTPDRMLEYAMDKGADLAYLERLLALRREHEKDEARKAYSVAFSAFKAEKVEVLKRKRVGFTSKRAGVGPTSYSHAELSDVTDALGPAMANHGLSYSWDVDNSSRAPLVVVTCVIEHVLGHSKSVTMEALPDNSGNKNGIQQTGSTVTYLQRYTLLAAAGISTKGMDDDGRGAGPDGGGDEGEGGQDEGHPDPLIADLYSAADEGTEALDAAWARCTPEQRNRVGAEWLKIKKRGARHD